MTLNALKELKIHTAVSSPQHVFLIMALLFGVAFVYLIPPFMAPDEWMHFHRAYYISEGHLTAEKIQDGGKEVIGASLPLRLYSTEMFAMWRIPYSAEKERVMLPLFLRTHRDPTDLKKKFTCECISTLYSQKKPVTGNEALLFTSFPISSRYSPHLYFPQAFAIEMGKLLGTPMIGLMYYGRLFNLLLWALFIFLAIRITPVFKWMSLVLSLTPTSIFQASSLSADVMTNGMSVLFIACVLKIAFGEGKKRILLTALFLLAMLVSVSKGYFLLNFLFLIIPRYKIGSRKSYWGVFLSLIILTLVTIIIYSRFFVQYVIPFQEAGFHVAPNEQMSLIIKSPLHYLAILWHTLFVSAKMYIMTFVGRLGHKWPDMPLWFVCLHISALVCVALVDSNRKVVIGRKAKIIFGSVFLFSVLLIMTILYLTWSPVGSSHIEGVIGRHFIPIAPLFFLMFYNRRLNTERYSAQANLGIFCYSFSVLSLSSLVIFNNYWM